VKVAIVLLAVAIAGSIGAAIWFMSERNDTSQVATVPTLTAEGRMPSLGQTDGWLHSDPLTDADLRGKVVLINFWTYSCINWRRQLPYIRAWADKYKDKGLVVIGVHTPEFDFERDIDNVRHAAEGFQINYPIALDSSYSIWNAFANRYWPALYFIDVNGNIRHHHFGEGDYVRSERVIQQLLREAGSDDFDSDIAEVNSNGAEADADWNNLYSAENYLGYDRTQSFSSSGGTELNKPHVYGFPDRLELGDWALSGNWTFGHQAITLTRAPGSVEYRFHSRDLHVVMGPSAAKAPIRFRVRIIGQPTGDAHGVDVDEQGNGTITEPRMYQLIRQTNSISDKTIEIEFLDPGVQLFSFTFG